MTDNIATNRDMVQKVANFLGDLVNEVVFLGGAATGLLITDSAASDIRPTKDVDVIVEVTTTADYHRLADELRGRGFREDTRDDAPLCRWLIEDMVVDVMPTDETSLGFGNRWYKDAYSHAKTMVLDSLDVRVVTGPYFLATKIEAFSGRGNEDFMASHDMEDVIALIDGRPGLIDEIAQESEALLSFLAQTFGRLKDNQRFRESLPGHLAGDIASQQRLPILEARIEKISRLIKET